jgi:PAS domain S-box-containing protein
MSLDTILAGRYTDLQGVAAKKAGMTRKRKTKKPSKPRSRGKGRTSSKKKGVAGREALSRAKRVNGMPICERLAYLLTETSVVIYAARVGANYAATFVSDNIRRLAGYSARSFLNKPTFWIDHVHPEDRERVLKEIPSVFKHGYYEYEYRFRHKDGTYIWVHDEMRLICDDSGKPREIVGYWIDITKRKRMEEDIQKRTARILDFMESAAEGFVLMDSKFNVLHVNRYLLDKCGWKIEDARQVNVLDFSADLWESGRYEQYLEVLETGKPRVFEDIIISLQDEEKHVTLVAFKVGGDIGLIVQDITDQKKAAQRLRGSEERLQSMYESIPAGIVFHDAQGVVLLANSMACEILDVDEEEMVGSKLHKLLGEIVDERGVVLAKDENPVAKTLSTSTPIRNAIIGFAQKAPFRKRWLLISTQPIFDPVTNKLDEVLVTFADFTEQKQIEEALLESEERYRHLYENSPIGIGIATLDGKVITANKSMLDIVGYDLDEFRRINIAETYESSADRERLLEALSRDGRVTDYRARLRRKDGTVYDAILHISRINIGGKDCLHTICQLAP